MPGAKGFDDWIEIFKGGRQIDSKGRSHDGDEIIRKAVESFDLAKHEPPLTLGHPKDNEPAYGWVKELKTGIRNGTRILSAKVGQVVPEFQEMLKKGLYKKRSASFYDDGRLRHVGFLGAKIPAVKGLADIRFNESDDCFSFETFNEQKEGKMTFKDFMEIFRFWKQVEEDPELKMPVSHAQTKEDTVDKSFTEADLEKVKKEAAEKAAGDAREEMKKEFAEKDRKQAAVDRKNKISDWCDTQIEKGKLAPAWVASGIKEFMESCNAEEEISFSEDRKESSLEWFKGFITDLPKLVDFSEIASREKDIGAGDAGTKLEKYTRDKMKENSELGYNAAFSEVQNEHPELVTEYILDMRGGE